MLAHNFFDFLATESVLEEQTNRLEPIYLSNFSKFWGIKMLLDILVLSVEKKTGTSEKAKVKFDSCIQNKNIPISQQWEIYL